jgi:hypothetical protein
MSLEGMMETNTNELVPIKRPEFILETLCGKARVLVHDATRVGVFLGARDTFGEGEFIVRGAGHHGNIHLEAPANFSTGFKATNTYFESRFEYFHAVIKRGNQSYYGCGGKGTTGIFRKAS